MSPVSVTRVAEVARERRDDRTHPRAAVRYTRASPGARRVEAVRERMVERRERENPTRTS